jgi:hypothetical protein
MTSDIEWPPTHRRALVVDLTDWRIVSVPLWWYPRLLRVTPEWRANFEIGRFGIHWRRWTDIEHAGLLLSAKAAGAAPPVEAQGPQHGMASSWLPWLTALVSVLTIGVGVWQYTDNKRPEERRLRFEQFRQVMTWVSGYESGQQPRVAQQIAAIYQLTEFPEYREMYDPTLQYLLWSAHHQSDPEHSDHHVIAAIEAVLTGER